ncbi:FRQ-interacting RNA helicase [Gaeumannomyces tritici R3-111a-1]|uniref:FRQ-interacting RNA helicase n=1 Tax=Gaeumannomyces tritici (strain R3-111a-1) TaxID=644352 RepID=J3NTA2_GAET3|nr:FRQ-interacting RNA helicase [Gaeumannomyces tritici R3-111a-1]EJT79417.1 FRQ-interacting RNA helicase [Gaeumannomyces tritici R3-111a-1]
MDLFDVFDEQPEAPPAEAERISSEQKSSEHKSKKSKSKSKKDKSKKRKADGHVKMEEATEELTLDSVPEDPAADRDVEMGNGTQPSTEGGAGAEDDSGSEDHGDSKRRKKGATAEPILTDSFATAESRQVAPVEGFSAAAGEEAIVLQHNVQHQVALPPDLDYIYVPLSQHKPPDEPARVYRFKLDPFQSISVASIERGESVLVSAHTSAGKTVVAEYAIAQCLKRNQRVIYTSPIKALSNQKYREFQAEFGDVGLMTGDVTINPTASCLVMTTEILRSMLYRGSEIMREVAWVIFDEIHYMRDAIRGVVWEETIIMLPDKVRYVFLSATIPNAFQFAEWIAKIHRQACHVVYTDFRPTPLQNYFFPAGGEGIYLVVDENGVFREKNFNSAIAAIEDNKSKDANDPNARQTGKGKNKKPRKDTGPDAKSDITKIVKMIMKKAFHPVIVFNFSKRECENLALKVSSMNFNHETEQQLVDDIFHNAIMSLSEEDQNLPQIQHLIPLLKKGIGVHHGGLLPILKETIEILFQEGLIKVLFATETFSIGLNMPARTVVFSQVTKFDGVKERPLTSSEYIQMAGRAGRRGLDDRGIVIMMIGEQLEPEVAKGIVAGQQDRLNSAFHLGYNMILNLQRIETVSPEYMLERCFYQFQNAAGVPMLEKKVRDLQQEKDGMVIPDEGTIKDYHNVRLQIEEYKKDMEAVIQHPNYCLEFMQPGRLVRIKTPDGLDFDWGAIVNFTKRKDAKFGEPEHSPQESVMIDVALFVSHNTDEIVPGVVPKKGHMTEGVTPQGPSEEEGKIEIIPCLLTCLVGISQLRVFMPKDILNREGKNAIGKVLTEVHNRFPDGLPILDPIETMGIKDESFKKLMRKIEVLESRLLSNPLHQSPHLPELWDQYKAKVELSNQIKEAKKAINKAHSIAQLDELKSRMRVLRRLGFINDAEVVQMKARVACEISSTEGHELVLAELLFNGFFNDLTPDVCAAILSCFVFDEKMEAEPLKEDLDKLVRQVHAQAKTIARISRESKLDMPDEKVVASLKWQLMDTVLAWAKGRPFIEICKMNSAYEGSLVRIIRRLEELLRQMAEAGKVMGSETLQKKFDTALSLIARDVVSAASLYL